MNGKITLCLATFLMLLNITSASLNAQNYLISFTGSGAATTVSSIKVENLNRRTSVTLRAGDRLNLTSSTGIEQPGTGEGTFQVYPNPMSEVSNIFLFAPSSGNCVLTVISITGQIIAQSSSFLSQGMHSFRLSGISQGIYIAVLKGNGYQYTTRLVSESRATCQPLIKNESCESRIVKSSSSVVKMKYAGGEHLKYTATSEPYIAILADIPVRDTTITFQFAECLDQSGIHYPTVQIGEQIWMAENLRTTKFNDGEVIPCVTGNQAWWNLRTPSYYIGAFNQSYLKNYGAWYNWYCANSGKLAPAGWHIPTHAEWRTLAASLGGPEVAGGKMKTTGFVHWFNPNTGATNYSGFSAYPVGYRNYDGVDFNLPGDLAAFWSADILNSTQGLGTRLLYDTQAFKIESYGVSKNYGYSVRCVKD